MPRFLYTVLGILRSQYERLWNTGSDSGSTFRVEERDDVDHFQAFKRNNNAYFYGAHQSHERHKTLTARTFSPTPCEVSVKSQKSRMTWKVKKKKKSPVLKKVSKCLRVGWNNDILTIRTAGSSISGAGLNTLQTLFSPWISEI